MKSDRIKEAFYELKDTLIGAKIDGVRQLDDYSFIFSMFGSGKKLSLLLSVLKRLRRFHFLFEKVHKEYLFSSNAVSVFKKYLLKGRIRRAVMYEQCVELSIEHVGKYTLILDFLSCNIALFDEGNNVLFALHRRDIRKPEESGPVTASIKNKGTGFFDFPLNEELSADFFNERKESLERAMFRIIKTEEKKVLRLSEKLYAEKKEIKSKEYYKKIGELLKYNLSRVPRGTETAMLNDFDGREVTVNLNPRLSPLENMTFYFNKYKKLKKKEGRIDEKIQNQDKKLDLITDLKREIEAGNLSLTHSPALFAEHHDISIFGKEFIRKVENLHAAPGGKKTGKKEEKGPFLEFTTRSGKKILVGRNARSNEELSINVARGNDMWFHVEAGSGSHVILRYEKRGSFHAEDIIDAAVLALYFSKLRKEKKGDVVYTFCKYVKKPKNSKTGVVTYYNNKTRFISLDTEVLTGLLT